MENDLKTPGKIPTPWGYWNHCLRVAGEPWGSDRVNLARSGGLEPLAKWSVGVACPRFGWWAVDQRASSERNGAAAMEDHEGAPWGSRCLRDSMEEPAEESRPEVCARG
jgi:hypothetical protein